LVSRTFTTFEEDKHCWGRDIRLAGRGRSFVRVVDQPQLFDVDIKRSAPGHLAWDTEELANDFPEALDDVQRLIEKNFQQECFVTPAVIEQETQERLDRVLGMNEVGSNNLKLTSNHELSKEGNPFH
jgi:hypothetical protein